MRSLQVKVCEKTSYTAKSWCFGKWFFVYWKLKLHTYFFIISCWLGHSPKYIIHQVLQWAILPKFSPSKILHHMFKIATVTRSNSFKLYKDFCHLNCRIHLFTQWTINDWNGLPYEMVEYNNFIWLLKAELDYLQFVL